ncbi:MAG: methyltransferase domain-containing protein [Spirochaetes bacterium]|jgi:protein-L-isoaspartate(D-aspartate) O-methyltransferase|nr:methyltransferase domain-containing protein [Spirochaetota bacterium]
MKKSPYYDRKKKFINEIVEAGIRKEIIKHFSDVEPSIFFDSLFEDRFYTEKSIPIGYGEYGDNFVTLAKMLNLLDPDSNGRILEVGTGSGFSTALLSLLYREVFTIDFNEDLAVSAKKRLYNYGYENIRFYAGDASTKTDTIDEKFDGIIIHAACLKRPFTIITLLKEKAPIVFPMGPPIQQQITVLLNEPSPETGSNFRTRFLDFVQCSHIQGPYGYDTPNIPDIYRDYIEDENEDIAGNEADNK